MRESVSPRGEGGDTSRVSASAHADMMFTGFLRKTRDHSKCHRVPFSSCGGQKHRIVVAWSFCFVTNLEEGGAA